MRNIKTKMILDCKRKRMSLTFSKNKAALFTRTSNKVLISLDEFISLSVHTTLLKEFLTKLVPSLLSNGKMGS